MDNFDFQQLMKTFSEICPDFTEEPDFKRATVSRRFAEQVLFGYIEEIKQAKLNKVDKSWRFTLDSHGKEGKIFAEVIILYARNQPPIYQPVMLHGSLKLTFKQASLLAVAKYCQIVPHLVERKQITLTPLAGAIFNSDDMPRLASELNEPLHKVVMAVISSCQTNGFYLEHSRCCITLRALQKNVVDRDMRISLLKKNFKSYQLQGKTFNLRDYLIFCKYVRRDTQKRPGISPPQDLDYLITEVMSLDILRECTPNHSPPVVPIVRKQKPNMKCAAFFSNKK